MLNTTIRTAEMKIVVLVCNFSEPNLSGFLSFIWATTGINFSPRPVTASTRSRVGDFQTPARHRTWDADYSKSAARQPAALAAQIKMRTTEVILQMNEIKGASRLTPFEFEPFQMGPSR